VSSSFFTRWRVRAGYPVVIAILYFARPTPLTILIGAGLGFAGLLIRGYAAGYLRKQERLATQGAYAWTRNPLYFGSAWLAAGLAVAARSVPSAVLALFYFAIFYYAVMRREEDELRHNFGAEFDEYAKKVPLFSPGFPSAKNPESGVSAFSWGQYWKNREYMAAFGFLLLIGVLTLLWAWRFA